MYFRHIFYMYILYMHTCTDRLIGQSTNCLILCSNSLHVPYQAKSSGSLQRLCIFVVVGFIYTFGN